MDRVTADLENKRYEFTIHTFGCKVNTYDTGLLQTRFASSAFLAPRVSKSAIEAVPRSCASSPHVHILNTCAVTAEATRDAARLVRRLKAREPFSKVVLTGCGAQVDGKIFDELPGVDLVVANSHKGQIEFLIEQLFKGTLEQKVFRSNIFFKDDLEIGGGKEAGHTRTFLKIQDGCNSFCTYCVIPFARGKSRSIPAQALVSRIGELHENGVEEVVLTGVHIGDYEDKDKSKLFGLEDLVREILLKTKIPRLRLSSLEPVELTRGLLDLYGEFERLCPHFHMSIQSASNRVLHAMRRNYGAAEVESALLNIAEVLPQAFVGMDVIAGFPGETEEEFFETYERLAGLPWTRLHVFPYSERPGTKAARLDGAVSVVERAQRATRLRELSLSRYEGLARAQVGTVKETLLLGRAGAAKESTNSASPVRGLSRDYWPVRIQNSGIEERTGREVLVKITGYQRENLSRDEGVLFGECIDREIGLTSVSQAL